LVVKSVECAGRLSIAPIAQATCQLRQLRIWRI